MLNFKIVCMLISSFMAVSARNVHASDNVETLLGLLEARAHSFTVVEWRFDTVAMKGPAVFELPFADDMLKSAHDKGLQNYPVDARDHVKGFALFDLKKEHYKLEFDLTYPRPDDPSKVTVERRVMSFSGELFVDLVEPIYDKKQGVQIAPVRVEFDRVYRDVGLRRGMLIKSGYFFTPHHLPLIRGISDVNELTWTLTNFLKECRKNPKVKFTVRSRDLWVVSFPLTLESRDYGFAEYRFNPTRGGVIESVASLPRENGPASDEYIYKNIDMGSGIYGPSEVLWIDWVNGMGRRTKITDVKVNGELNEKSFLVSVPVGAMVNDQEHQMFYTASKGPMADAQAIGKYMEVNDVALSHTKKNSSSFRVIFGVSVIIALLCTSIWWRRGRAVCLALILLVPCGCDSKTSEAGNVPAIQFAKSHSDFVWDDGWKWSFSKRETVCVSQCGFTASTLVLRLLSRAFWMTDFGVVQSSWWVVIELV